MDSQEFICQDPFGLRLGKSSIFETSFAEIHLDFHLPQIPFVGFHLQRFTLTCTCQELSSLTTLDELNFARSFPFELHLLTFIGLHHVKLQLKLFHNCYYSLYQVPTFVYLTHIRSYVKFGLNFFLINFPTTLKIIDDVNMTASTVFPLSQTFQGLIALIH